MTQSQPLLGWLSSSTDIMPINIQEKFGNTWQKQAESDLGQYLWTAPATVHGQTWS